MDSAEGKVSWNYILFGCACVVQSFLCIIKFLLASLVYRANVSYVDLHGIMTIT